MGFSTEWVSIMKGIVPQAFTQSANTPNLRGVVIDGQIQMMKPHFIKTMDMFYRIQYANVINRYTERGPDDLVCVLMFDDYTHTPESKAMTQHRRKARVTEVLPFTEDDALPWEACPPNWEGAMCNRVFKTKLIRSITEKMGSMVKLRARQRLIVDFMGAPLEYSTVPGGMMVSGDAGVFARHLEGVEGIGEADCKFPRCVLPFVLPTSFGSWKTFFS
jgi:hypothetical protein